MSLRAAAALTSDPLCTLRLHRVGFGFSVVGCGIRELGCRTGFISSDLLILVSTEQARNHMHVVLCFSPIGDSFRIRCRKFPALVRSLLLRCSLLYATPLMLVATRHFGGARFSFVALMPHYVTYPHSHLSSLTLIVTYLALSPAARPSTGFQSGPWKRSRR